MKGKIAALVAAVAAAASAAGAATLAKRRKGEGQASPELTPGRARSSPAEAPPTLPDADDLTAIKGLGKVKAQKLVEAGVTSYAQIAAWSDEDIAEIGLKVNTSPGQIKREDWVGQAKALSEG